MANRQKIHPVAVVEAPPPTAPWPPPGPATSHKVCPSHAYHRQPSAIVNNPDITQSNPPKTRSRCCKCICWTISLLFLLLVFLAAAVGILYLVFKPKLPTYSVDRLRISNLRLNYDMTLYATLGVKITANNPNKKIGIYYEEGGHLSVWYTTAKLCKGALPIFYQGHQNVTKLDVILTGQTQSGSPLLRALQKQQQTGQIPLNLKVDAPVAIKLGKLKLRRVRILGECMLVVDSMAANNKVSIKASNCRFKLKL
ncbi:Late embryogenesis abundant hydroxyproline-rich glycoprotein family [Tripterygium wilfordii]|uniref:Late embryogenesis abundant hydroxyproline-rich glycoprotein family n=1 Tax=Tripterygium wilfordii TaxID=458696 RepID=A0A7J7C8D1_TRIWF|nr:NDR1/HIN1-like protein 6 [Tripterygium wilfordii]KAF5730401.1 Late embryogenesis abundant hydroxyproline-rich glycoprotein family [Tripterygium wilfordii]